MMMTKSNESISNRRNDGVGHASHILGTGRYRYVRGLDVRHVDEDVPVEMATKVDLNLGCTTRQKHSNKRAATSSTDVNGSSGD